jgi:hypothetical protein
MNRLIRPLLAVVLASLGVVSVQAQTSPLWGDLKPGPHRVGFKSIFTYDPSRPQLPSALKNSLGRQMQINVWYPAKSNGTSMVFEDYVHLLAQEIDFSPLTDKKRNDGTAKFIQQANELARNDSRVSSGLSSVMKFPVAARRNASPVKGRFPIVVYLDSAARHHILCEYLASHGYVVAATSIKGSFEEELDVALTGIETLAADIQFVVGSMKGWSNAAPDQVALIGLGITASGALNAQMRNSDIDALVSLEGGITTLFEDRMLKRLPFFDLASVRVPLLAITAPHPNVNPAVLDQYKYSTRYYVHFPKMSEFFFLNYGMLEKYIPRIIGEPPGDTKAGFEWAARYVLAFFNTHLKHDSTSESFLRNSPENNSIPTGLLSVDKKIGLKVPPRLGELKTMIRLGSIERLTSVYRQFKESDPRPFSQELLIGLYNWISFVGDPEWKARKEISLIRVESYPESSRAHFTLAQVGMQLSDTSLARKHFSEALRVLPNDDDLVLDGATRRRIEQTAKQQLERLGN